MATSNLYMLKAIYYLISLYSVQIIGLVSLKFLLRHLH